MKILVLISQDVKKEENDLIKKLPNNVNATIVRDYDSVQRLFSKTTYELLLVISNKEVYPPDLNISNSMIPDKVKKVVINGVSEINDILISSLLDSLKIVITTKKENPLITESMAFIGENIFNEDLSLEKVASHVYVSRCHYSKMFKKHFGKGFKEYVISKRIERAMQLLIEGNSVTDVCYAVGYNDLTHFSRVFKKYVGINPSVYKQRYINFHEISNCS